MSKKSLIKSEQRAFVYAQPCPGSDPCWYLKIDAVRDAKMVLETASEGVINDSARTMQHDMFRSPSPSTRATELEIEIKFKALGRMITGLGDRDGWFLNRNGGMCPSLHNVIKTVKSDFFPDEIKKFDIQDVRFSQWRGGTHWYARLPDGTDIEVDGDLKWNSRKEAVAAAKKFLRNR